MAAEPLKAPDSWLTYKQLPGLVLGFHGCDRDAAEEVLSGQRSHLVHSSNEYDWLGGGIYFWERDPWRALSWASDEGLKSYQTVRAAFLEGRALYEGAGFRRKNHIQIAVKDSRCIKAYFRLPDHP
jgi:hypothetical protein